MTNSDTQYIYIVQASLEKSKCKIGKTNDLERRLKEYNNITGKSKENLYQYLFCCEVENATVVENDIKKEFSFLREEKSKEIYFYNSDLFEKYVNFIKSQNGFIKEVFIKKDEPKQVTKIVKKTTPTLQERGLSRIDIMNKAKRMQNDEFYTRYEDVEKEISMYDKNIWADKVVFCNCDDAVDNEKRNTSAFALYFLKNFNELGLKKLICTHYSGGIDLFNQGAKGYIFTREFTKEGFKEIKDYPKDYTGSFDDSLSLKILNEEADIVCTNPPFSKAIDYWKILIESGKKFLIISNIINVVTPVFIPYFKEKKVWAGHDEVHWYLNYKKELTRAAGVWYTNIPIKDRQKYKNLKITQLKKIPGKYIKYDDKKVLLVDNCYIPSDYKKPFAVSSTPILSGLLEKGYEIVEDTKYHPFVKGKEKFGRVLVQKVDEKKMNKISN